METLVTFCFWSDFLFDFFFNAIKKQLHLSPYLPSYVFVENLGKSHKMKWTKITETHQLKIFTISILTYFLFLLFYFASKIIGVI